MKKPASLLMFLLIAMTTIAQPQLENAGFEAWEGSGTSAKPVDWSSIKTSTGGLAIALPQVCFQTTDAHSGSNALRIRSTSLPAQTVAGIITCGRINASQTEGGSVFSDTENAQWNGSLLDRPDSLVVWYKAAPQGSDFPSIQAILHFNEGRYPEGGTIGNWVGQTSWTGASGAGITEWTRISLPFTYLSEVAPEFMLIAMTSSEVGAALANSEVLYDDVTLIYNITPELSEAVATVSPQDGYPIQVTFSTPGTPVATSTFTAELSDVNGEFSQPITIGSATTALPSGIIAAIIPANTASGNGYRIRVSNPDPNYAPVSVPLEVVLSTTVGLANHHTSAISAVFQNDKLMVSTGNTTLKSPTIELIASTGQTVLAVAMPSHTQHSINVGTLRGFYILRITDSEHTFVKRVALF